MKKFALGGAVLSLAMAAPAHATTYYDLNVYDSTTSFTGTLGTVSVDGLGSNFLTFDVSLNNNVYFQLPGAGNNTPIPVFWFNLNDGSTPFTGSVTTNITTPDNPSGPPGGDYPTGGQFAIVGPTSLGHGWSSGSYGATDVDTVGASDYYHGDLIFTLQATAGSVLSLVSSTHNGSTVYGGADLRQCPDTGGCNTGPVGFSLSPRQESTTPEPATWAMMLVGFGFVGAAMRRRSQHQAVRLTYV
jgi:hypothetical protein